METYEPKRDRLVLCWTWDPQSGSCLVVNVVCVPTTVEWSYEKDGPVDDGGTRR